MFVSTSKHPSHVREFHTGSISNYEFHSMMMSPTEQIMSD